MDAAELLKKIPYMLMVLAGLGFIFQLYFGGLLSLEQEITDAQRSDFRQLSVLENTINEDTTLEEVEATSTGYRFEDRRAVLPVEYFTNQDPGGDEIGYSKTSEGVCYIPEVSGLAGERFGVVVKPLDQVEEGARDPRELSCTSTNPIPTTGADPVSSPVLLVRKANNQNPRLPARVYIYKTQSAAT